MLGFFEVHQGESWSPTNRDASFSNSGLTCTGGGGGGATFVAALCSQRLYNNQKIYFEVTIVNTITAVGGIGLANPSASVSTYLGADANGVSWYFGSPTGYWSYGGSQHANNIPVPGNGDNCSFALDGVNKLIWARLNGGNWNADVIGNQNPATATGGFDCSTIFSSQTYLSIGMISGNLAESYTLIPNSSSFVYTPPVGFRSPNSLATK